MRLIRPPRGGRAPSDPGSTTSAEEEWIRSWTRPLAELVTGPQAWGRRAAAAVEANARLTATTGIVLLVMLAVEGATLLSIRRLLPVHLAVGLMLIPPVLLKLASTGRRFAGYYLGDARYRAAGPPPILLRLIGPLLILSTVALLGTGVELWLFGTRLGAIWLTMHQGFFAIWFGLMAVHVVGHLEQAPTLVLRDAGERPPLPGRTRRRAWVTASLVMGATLAASTLVWQSPFVAALAH
ncbi:MAG: hypothetical protein ACLQT7_02915 [Candidatus Dormibacteria bacterium]